MLQSSSKTTARMLVKFGNSTHLCCSVMFHNSGAMFLSNNPPRDARVLLTPSIPLVSKTLTTPSAPWQRLTSRQDNLSETRRENDDGTSRTCQRCPRPAQPPWHCSRNRCNRYIRNRNPIATRCHRICWREPFSMPRHSPRDGCHWNHEAPPPQPSPQSLSQPEPN